MTSPAASPLPLPKIVQAPSTPPPGYPGGDLDADPSAAASAKPYRVEFFLAPWRRSGDKGPAHYLLIGVACAMYLFIVGGSLTYLAFKMESGTLHSASLILMGKVQFRTIFSPFQSKCTRTK